MEWNFTSSQVMKGEIIYSLEDFYKDLGAEIAENFPHLEEDKRDHLQRIFYRAQYMYCLGHNVKETARRTGLKEDFISLILSESKANCEMLRSIMMALFLSNLKASDGALNDRHNLQLLNDVLYKFHSTHNL